MRCINWQIGSFAVALAIGALGGSARAADSSAPKHITVVDDSTTGKALLGRFDYIGSWQHVHAKLDGRSNGTSTRSTHTGDVAIFSFSGTRIRVFGICGPSGGRAGIALDEASTGGKPVDFYSPRVHTHALMYESPKLAAGVHTLSIVVWGTRNERGHFYYVNIDGVEVES